MLVGCAGMTPTEQRILSGGAIGAGTGAAIGAATGGDAGVGAAIGGAAGAVGGAIVDQAERRRQYDADPGYYERERYYDHRDPYYHQRERRFEDRDPGYYERGYHGERYYRDDGF